MKPGRLAIVVSVAVGLMGSPQTSLQGASIAAMVWVSPSNLKKIRGENGPFPSKNCTRENTVPLVCVLARDGHVLKCSPIPWIQIDGVRTEKLMAKPLVKEAHGIARSWAFAPVVPVKTSREEMYLTLVEVSFVPATAAAPQP